MIVRLASLLAGPALSWLAGAAVAGLLALGAAWKVQSWRLDAAQADVARLGRELTDAKAATRQRETLIAALERQAQATAEAVARLEPIRREIHAAPRTTACVASPVVARGLERLRAARPAAAGAGAGAVAAGVPPGTGGP